VVSCIPSKCKLLTTSNANHDFDPLWRTRRTAARELEQLHARAPLTTTENKLARPWLAVCPPLAATQGLVQARYEDIGLHLINDLLHLLVQQVVLAGGEGSSSGWDV
jgi:hypothetical protein